MKKSVILIGLLSGCLLLSSCSFKRPLTAEAKTLQINSKDLKSTVVSSYLEQPVQAGRNIIYCSSFQLAWNEFEDNIIKDKLKLDGNPEMAVKLDKRLTDKNDISEKDYFVMSGYGRDNIVEKINKGLKDKFKDDAPKVEEQLFPDDIMAYAYLYKNLQFKDEFESLAEPLKFNGEDVKAFGINSKNSKNENIAKQVQVLYYKSPDDFVIKLISKSENDEFILAKLTPGTDLLKTIEAVNTRIKDGEETGLYENETLRIPKFSFDITRDFDEILQRSILNKGFEGYFIAKARQDTRFILDEKGAVLKSEGRIIAQKSAPVMVRSFIFDKPFLIMMREKGAKAPYFALWAETAELMVK